ncbi:RagB/SusD family nutrient uptake outer membrane protein, partial [Collinsella sp. BIOML-A1]|nr:RagB/SusD family nutrient uptake outer membrane protein [Collinsella sp. BIOML-A1]
INNVDAVPRMEEELKIIYKAEANFLIAYYHFMLLRAYGPIIIMDHEVSVSSTEKLKRSPFDVCVKWIADKYDEACNNGLLAVQSSSYYGRATQLAAKALKARLYLYAASPLFNGNSFYANSSLYDPETNEPLMPLDYNPSKWNTALTACQEALTLADEQKYTQFQIANESEIPEECWPKDLIQYALKMQIMDKKNMEVIWADTRTEGVYGPQNQSAPRDPVNGGNSWNGVGPTLDFVKVFYTENGLPIDEDPEFDYQNRFSVVPFPDGATYGEGQTIKLNVDREPRFYAWIAFQNGYYECQTESKENAYVAKAERAEGKKWLTDFTEQGNCGKQGRNNNYSKTGYLNKKGVHPGVAASKSQKEPSK